MKGRILLSVLIFTAPLTAFAHGGHPDAVGPPNSVLHYVASPWHIIPIVTVAVAVVALRYYAVKKQVQVTNKIND